MSEVDWGTEANEAPKPKSRVPKWAWFCGGGCLLALILGGVLAFLIFKKAQEAMDVDKQSASLAEELPFDALPEDYTFIGIGAFAGMLPGIDNAWMLQRTDGTVQAQFQLLEPEASLVRREAIRTGELGPDAKQQFGPIGLHGLEHGEIEIQGRTLPWMRFQTFEPSAAKEAGADTEQAEKAEPSFGDAIELASRQRILFLDLTRDGAAGALILQYTAVGDGGPVEPAEVAELLKPFHVGPKR
ncbi:MAG: hypothetical protein JNN27_11390 [Planctomycetes bacterium]|nr:hypothetical protein [Planctomycetota bacterium]